MNCIPEMLASTLAWAPVGPWEVAIVLLVALLLFGGKKLPELARGLGRGLRLFKKEMRGVQEDIDQALDEEDPPRSRAQSSDDDDKTDASA